VYKLHCTTSSSTFAIDKNVSIESIAEYEHIRFLPESKISP
jgi:hypothetical protein